MRALIETWFKIAFATCAVLGSVGTASAQPSPENFISQFDQVRLSPNGEYIGMLRPFEGRNALVIGRTDGSDDPVVIPAGDNIDILYFDWISDERLLLNAGWAYLYRPYNAAIETTRLRLLGVNRDGSNLEDWGGYGAGNIIDYLRHDPDHILVQRFHDGFWSYFEKEIDEGTVVPRGKGRTDYGDFVTDLDGEVLALLDSNRTHRRLWVRPYGTVDWQLIFRAEHFEGRDMRPLKVLEGGRYLYVLSNHEGRNALYRFAIEGGSDFELVYMHDEYDLDGFEYSEADDAPLYVSYMADLPMRHYFDEEMGALHERLNRSLPGAVERIVSSDDAGRRHIVLSSGPNEPPIYYLLDTQEGTIVELAQSYPELSVDEMADVTAFTYSARDGMEIPGYLAVPPGMGDGPYPLVVWPHGGPHARRDQDFFPLIQFIATRGYAVFYPNFRGSTGYGNAFYEAGLREWGGAMQTDVEDGVAYLIGEGLAEPGRICVVGWSYGAYVSTLSTILTPDLYECAVGINGVYDLREMHRELGRDFQRGAQAWWRHTMGSDNAVLRRISPARRASEIQTPLLLIYSQEDRTVPTNQFDVMRAALDDAGVDYSFREFEEGNHSMSYGPSMTGTLQEIENFLAQHLH